jgi:hypothetical protein
MWFDLKRLGEYLLYTIFGLVNLALCTLYHYHDSLVVISHKPFRLPKS